MIKGLLFDLDHTFYDYFSCHEAALAKAISFLKKKSKWHQTKLQAAYHAARKRVHRDLKGQGASHSRLLYFQKTIEALAGRSLPKITLQTEEVYWQTFLAKMDLADGAANFLKTAQKHQLKVAIVSNLTAQIQMRKLERLGLSGYIDFLVTSEEAGVEKPARRIFELALEKLELKISQVCYIGDDESVDIAGAVKMGIKAYYLHKDPPQDKRTIWVRDFKSLKKLLFQE